MERSFNFHSPPQLKKTCRRKNNVLPTLNFPFNAILPLTLPEFSINTCSNIFPCPRLQNTKFGKVKYHKHQLSLGGSSFFSSNRKKSRPPTVYGRTRTQDWRDFWWSCWNRTKFWQKKKCENLLLKTETPLILKSMGNLKWFRFFRSETFWGSVFQMLCPKLSGLLRFASDGNWWRAFLSCLLTKMQEKDISKFPCRATSKNVRT